MYKTFYFDVVSYASCLCIFITVSVMAVITSFVWGIRGVLEVKSESSALELIWTMIPTLFILFLCILNVSVVLSDLEIEMQYITKIMGRQWYWSYEDQDDDNFDSYMTQLVKNVDQAMVMWYATPTRLLVTSSDVIHSFSVPDLGMKVDAMPGRINQFMIKPDRVGSFVGYCSELCGTGHSYMPIVMEVMSPHYYRYLYYMVTRD